MLKICQKYPDFCDRNLILCFSLATRVFNGFFRNFQKSRRNDQFKQRIMQILLSKYSKKILMKLTIYGRVNDSMEHLQIAVDFGSLSARADVALLFFNQKLANEVFKKSFQLMQNGSVLGCPDCKGMLAHFYTKGFKGLVTPCYQTAYHYACESAEAGSLFGKMALAHFLRFISDFNDPDEDTFYIFWTDPYIQNFAADSPANWNNSQGRIDSDLEDWFEETDILRRHDLLRIAKLLIAEIQREHARNPNIPKVWLNLPFL